MNTRFARIESASHEDPKRPADSRDPETQRADDPQLAPDPPPRPAATQPKLRRGFAAMDRRTVAEIARKGGRAAHFAGTAHHFTSDEARIAGRKGGQTTHARRRDALQHRDVPRDSLGRRGDKEAT